jgi:hypothetical protein
LLGDDHVGVDIDHLQGRGDAIQSGEFVHLDRPCGKPSRGRAVRSFTGLYLRA